MKILFILIVLIVAAFFAGQLFTSLLYKDTKTHLSEKQQTFTHLAPEQFNAELSTGEYILLDVRTSDEYAAGHIKDAKQIDYYQTKQFSNYLDTLDRNNKYLIYCRTGVRSGKTLNIMQEKGFKDVSDMTGGYNAWVADNFPVVK
jgi:rhodanese-related sulfurtransferase